MSKNTLALVNGGAFIEMAGWVGVNQATPSVVATTNPSSIILFGNADNSYASTSGGIKLVMQLKKPQSTFLQGTLMCGSFSSPTSHPWLKATYSPATALGACRSRIRALPILSAFDYTTTTWNSVLGMTFATAGQSSDLILAQINSGVTTTSLVLAGGDAANLWLAFNFSTGIATKVYGFLIEVLPIVTQTNLTLESAECFIALMDKKYMRPRYFTATA